MSRKKDLFKSQNPNKIISSADFGKLSEDVESADFIKQKIKQQKIFTPKTDFSNPANFAKYGLAEEYYETSVENIYKTYPYDGSRSEKEAWYNNASYLDQYIFDNEYPRTNGYITIGPGNWGSPTILHEYGLPSIVEYITFNGGPHKAFEPAGARTGSLANYYKTSKNRENNLKINLEEGTTVEFWMRKQQFNSSFTPKEVVFDLWNGQASSSADYGRFRIEMSASATTSDAVFRYTLRSGSTGPSNESFSPSFAQANIADGNWHHYAFSFVSSSGGLVEAKLYRDGQFYGKNLTGTAFSSVTGTMSASIGALRAGPQETRYHSTTMTGYGKLVNTSLDEFRFWKKSRTPKQIYDNYNYQVGGGVNTDDSNTDLGVYYKFNEGISNTRIDSVVLDYSGRVSNGNWIGYSSGVRSTGSAFVEATASLREFKDPIIYSFHPAVRNTKDNLAATGSLHDRSNNASLFNTVPTWILEEDESYGGSNLKNLTQIMSSYLDTLYLQTEEITKINEVEYTSGTLKPNVFGDRLLSDRGLLAPELFVNADIVEQLYSRNDKTNFEKELPEIKNKIYENVYNNLVNIYKSKGTYDSFRNVLNTLGISQKIVDIKLHANNAEYEILDNRKQVLERKKKLNFFKTNYNNATVYQATGSTLYGTVPQSLSYIPQAPDNTGSFTPWTVESRFTLPKDNINSNYYFIENNYVTCSLFGFDRPHDTDFNDYTWATTNNTSLHVYAVRDKSTHKDGYFYLSSSNEAVAGIELTSSVISNLFNDTEWNLAVRFVPVKNPIETIVSGGVVPGPPSEPGRTFYKFDFKGASLRAGDVDEQFLVTSSYFDHSNESGGKFYSLMGAPKRFYIGAHRTNWTGSVYRNSYTFAKFHNFNFWLNNVSDDDVVSHLRDPKNYGLTKTYQSSDDSFFERGYQNSLYNTNGDGVPNIDTLALRYDFETVTGSDANGQFVINDTTTAGDPNYKYGIFGSIAKQYQYIGRGDHFDANADDVVKSELINSYKLSSIDSVISNDMVQIRTEDDEIFLPDMRPEEYFFSVEKNFYNAINESILETFSTLKDFNNLIGDPANRYRPEYKDLQKYRQLFFERVQNDLDFERFIEYYKWIDTSISSIISQLMPASADFSPNLSNVVESHILERNKFQHKLPVIKPQTAYSGTLAMTEHTNTSNPWNKNPSFTGLISRPENVGSAPPITAKEIQIVSTGSFITTITASIKNIVDLTYRSFNTPSYRSGSDNLNIINVRRTKLRFKKGPNYSEGYSQVMIPNRDGNSPYILDDPFNSVADVYDSLVVSGVVDYMIPTRPNLGNFITPRFSAPGGPEVNSLGNLDYETTQYSVYNNINYRNLVVRKALEEMRLSASMDPTLFIDASDAASHNQNYRNPHKEYMSGAAIDSRLVETFYDNAWITYPLPPSDLQYSWITSSYVSASFLRSQTDSDSIIFNSRVYYEWAVNPPVLGTAYSNIYNSSVGTGSNTVTANPATTSASHAYFGTIGKYNFSSWNQIRAGENIIARKHKQNNILSVADPIKQIEDRYTINGVRKISTYKGIVPNSFKNFIEPVTTKKYKPIKHQFVLNNDNNDILEVKTSYASMLAGFANRELNPRLRSKDCNVVDNYEAIKGLYLNSADPDSSPIKGWLSINYAEGVWPKEKYEGVNSHRDKPNYESTSTELKNNLCQYQTIWKNTALNRKRAATTIFPFTNANNSVGMKSAFCENIFPLSDYSLTNVETGYPYLDVYLRKQDVSAITPSELEISLNFAGTSQTFEPEQSAPNPIDSDLFNKFWCNAKGYSGGITDDQEQQAAILDLANKINKHPTASLYYVATQVVSGTGNFPYSVRIRSRFPGNDSSLTIAGNESWALDSTTADAGGAFSATSLSTVNNPIYNLDGELNSSFLAIDGYREGGYFGNTSASITPVLHSIATVVANDVKLTVSSSVYCEHYASYYYPTASQTYIHRPKSAILLAGTTDVAPYNGHPWRVAQSSSRDPFFNSYSEYVGNLKSITNDYSIVPEFNFSDHAAFYIDQKGENFRSENKKFLDIAGASGTTSSADAETSIYNSDFHKDYAYTEFLQQFNAVQQDHKQVGHVGEITLTCEGIKKFLPKQGFYPATRAVQLGTLFSQSIGPNLSGISATSVNSGTLDVSYSALADSSPLQTRQFNSAAALKLQSALQPLFSPGILYNTIKSGIAVDWPIVFSGSLVVAGNNDQLSASSNTIVSNASQRIPFETLTDMGQFPRDRDILYLYPTWQTASTAACTRYPYCSWNGFKGSGLYEGAMNNFLAEIPRFFLENEYFSDIRSAKESDFKPLELGKTYYMDIALGQTQNHFMWKDYFDGTVANASSVNSSYNGRAFGPPFDELGALNNAATIGQDPSYAPYTPPYFYGESIARVSFTPNASRKYTLGEIVAGSSVEYINSTLLSTTNSTTAAWKNRMNLSASVNLFEKVTLPKTTIITDPSTATSLTQQDIVDTNLESSIIGGAGTSITLEPTTDTDYDAWRIVPKFECPVLNFYNQPSETYMSRGMWGGLGELPSDGEGIFLKVMNSFSGSLFDIDSTGSLVDVLGFPTDNTVLNPPQRRIGSIAKEKTIQEAIVAIPFLERKNNNSVEADLTTIEKHNFFKIHKSVIQNQLKEGKDTTLTRMYKKMSKYVIPPNFNFAKYGDITPFVMYLFEFEASFDQQDLAYIWQGVMPDASLDGKEEVEKIQIKHQTGPDEFFHGKEVPSDIRWLVFKVKKKARKSYSNVIKLKSDDLDEYGYNWPYDYCSLVEMAKLEVDFKITPKEDVMESDMPIGKVLKGEQT